MKTVDLITNCKFTLYEARILEALSQSNYLTVKNIAFMSNVPMNKVYEIINNFIDKGYIELLEGKPKKYQVINLKQILKSNLEKEKEKIQTINKEINALKITKSDSNQSNFSIMQGKKSMINKVVETVDELKFESIGFIDIWTAKYENLEVAKKAIKRGVKIYFLGKITKENVDMVKAYLKIGVQIREYDVNDFGYSIFDSKYVQLRISKQNLTSLWVENGDFAKVLREHFFGIWKKCKKIEFDTNV